MQYKKNYIIYTMHTMINKILWRTLVGREYKHSLQHATWGNTLNLWHKWQITDAY